MAARWAASCWIGGAPAASGQASRPRSCQCTCWPRACPPGRSAPAARPRTCPGPSRMRPRGSQAWRLSPGRRGCQPIR
eukprot:2734387-Pyramimonas_sp.AAC.1